MLNWLLFISQECGSLMVDPEMTGLDLLLCGLYVLVNLKLLDKSNGTKDGVPLLS